MAASLVKSFTHSLTLFFGTRPFFFVYFLGDVAAIDNAYELAPFNEKIWVSLYAELCQVGAKPLIRQTFHQKFFLKEPPGAASLHFGYFLRAGQFFD